MGALTWIVYSSWKAMRVRAASKSLTQIATAVALLTSPALSASAPRLSAADFALARDYVFASCVIDRYPGTPLAAEADAWASGLVERGSLAASSYPELARLGRSAPEPQTTRNGIAMRLQSCADFVNSREFSTRLKDALRR